MLILFLWDLSTLSVMNHLWPHIYELNMYIWIEIRKAHKSRNKPKCEKEKIKGGNGKNAVVNLTTEANRTLIDQKVCLDKNS